MRDRSVVKRSRFHAIPERNRPASGPPAEVLLTGSTPHGPSVRGVPRRDDRVRPLGGAFSRNKTKPILIAASPRTGWRRFSEVVLRSPDLRRTPNPETCASDAFFVVRPTNAIHLFCNALSRAAMFHVVTFQRWSCGLPGDSVRRLLKRPPRKANTTPWLPQLFPEFKFPSCGSWNCKQPETRFTAPSETLPKTHRRFFLHNCGPPCFGNCPSEFNGRPLGTLSVW